MRFVLEFLWNPLAVVMPPPIFGIPDDYFDVKNILILPPSPFTNDELIYVLSENDIFGFFRQYGKFY